MGPGLSLKMLVGPGLLLGLKLAKVDYQTPENIIIVRVFYGLSQLFLFVLCAFIAHGIRSRGDATKTLKVVTPTSPMSPGEAPKETKVSFKDYDMGELQKLAKNFALCKLFDARGYLPTIKRSWYQNEGAAITVGIHVYMQVVPALLLQIVTQPLTLIDHPLFAIYVLNKDPAKDSKLKRPFPDNSPAGRLAASMNEAQKQKELQEQRDQPSTLALVDGGSTSGEIPVDTATGGNAQASISTAERRSARPNTVEE